MGKSWIDEYQRQIRRYERIVKLAKVAPWVIGALALVAGTMNIIAMVTR